MSGPIHDFFELVQTNLSNIILDGLYKGIKLSNTVVDENLKFFSNDETSGFVLDFLLMLLQNLQSLILQKDSYKKNPILITSSGNYIIVFTSLIKVIAFYILLNLVYVL